MLRKIDPTDQPELRKKIAINLGDLAEAMIKREPPFNQSPFYEQLGTYHSVQYYKYYNELPAEFRKEIIQIEIDRARHRISKDLLGNNCLPPFYEKHPSYEAISNKFNQWVLNKEGNVLISEGQGKEKFKETEIIKAVMKERMPFLRDSKELRFPGLSAFVMNLKDDHNVVLYIDKGTWRSSLYFFIGLDNPHFDIGLETFCGGMNEWHFQTKEELRAGMNNAIDLVENFLPYFKECVLRVL